MPANLTPQYLEAERRFREAKDPSAKAAALETMLAVIPKHKGTEKLQADLKRRLSKLRAEAERQRVAGKRTGIHVEREGIGQAVLIGRSNVGKSALLSRLTKATPAVAPYPFTTVRPQSGMVRFENVQIQLVDLPPIEPGITEGWVAGIIRNADIALVIVDLTADPPAQVEAIAQFLGASKVRLDGGGGGGSEEVGRVDLRTILIGNKLDESSAKDGLDLLETYYGGRYPILGVSAGTGMGLAHLPQRLYEALGVVRVYTKAPGKQPDRTQPVVVPAGSTVLEVGEQIHKDFAASLNFARVWGGTKFAGQKVPREYVVQEGDVIEFHL